MLTLRLAIASLLATPIAAFADGFSPVTQREIFVELVNARELRHPMGIRLVVTPDGQITGRAMGLPVTRRWEWQDGYFCREMEWSGTEIPFNCQLVEAKARERLRFTVDKGAGETATFRLQ